jgi:hypothetical protein
MCQHINMLEPLFASLLYFAIARIRFYSNMYFLNIDPLVTRAVL